MHRFYAMVDNPKLKPRHHVRVKAENKLDMELWLEFLQHPSVFCRPFEQFMVTEGVKIPWYSDASRNYSKGFGAWCQNSYTYGKWDKFVKSVHPSIEYLELYGVTVAVTLWVHRFANQKIQIFCDNQSVKAMIKNSSARCKNCMVLIRIITLFCMKHNVQLEPLYVESKKNGIADALSRREWTRFRRLSHDSMESKPMAIPECIWPIQKIWLF